MAAVESVPSNWMVNSGRMQIPSSSATSQMALHRTAESELSVCPLMNAIS